MQCISRAYYKIKFRVFKFNDIQGKYDKICKYEKRISDNENSFLSTYRESKGNWKKGRQFGLFYVEKMVIRKDIRLWNTF